MRIFAKDLFGEFLYSWDPSRTTDQDDFVDVAGGKLRIFECSEDRFSAAFDELVSQFFELPTASR